jgi:superfamily I DNA and/or RNA helicase
VAGETLQWRLRLREDVFGPASKAQKALRAYQAESNRIARVQSQQQAAMARLNAQAFRRDQQMRRAQERGSGLTYDERREMQDYMQKLWKEARDMEFSIQREIIENAQVVLATHGGISKQLAKKKFDLIVMDEASQGTEPLSWVPIVLGKKVIFAGDSCQLPPTIYSREAADRGLATTLFDRLKKQLPADLQSMLRIQYRMHEIIMGFSSRNFYDGLLIADESVRRHTAAELPGVQSSELVDNPVVYIDTAGTGYQEEWNELLDSRENDGEAQLALKIYEQLRYSGIQPEQIAVLAPYVAQVKKLRLIFKERGVEIGSVDSFQGREKEVVILSLVRSNDKMTTS